jgi:hypothetical protein
MMKKKPIFLDFNEGVPGKQAGENFIADRPNGLV